MPDRDAADALFERIATGQQIAVTPNETAAAVEESDSGSIESTSPDDSAPEGAELPSTPEGDPPAPDFTGQTAAERTCAVSS